MQVSMKSAIVDQIMTRAAEQLGDITKPVMKEFYTKFPGARERFEHYRADAPHRLEAEMVESVLYYLLEWPNASAALEIAIGGSACHHFDTLNIPSEHFLGLIEEIHALVATTIPGTKEGERQVWDQALKDMLAFCGNFVTPSVGHLDIPADTSS